jgi:hypothetical protein
MILLWVCAAAEDRSKRLRELLDKVRDRSKDHIVRLNEKNFF